MLRKYAIACAAILALCASAHAAPKTNSLNALAAWAGNDIAGAITASTAYPELQDQVGQACLGRMKTLGDLVKAHPLPLTANLATDIEYMRLMQGELNLICREPACAQMWTDATNFAQAVSVMPMLPSLTSLCAKVPIVGFTLSSPTSVVSPAK